MTSYWDIKEIAMRKIIAQDSTQRLQHYFPFNNSLGGKTSVIKAKQELYPMTEYHYHGRECSLR